MMSKTKSSELKFSIRNLIDTTPGEKNEKGLSTGIHHPQTNCPLKRLVAKSQAPLIRRPVPILNHKTPHPCWSFLSQFANKNANGNLPLNSSLIFLTKMSQMWEQIHRAQISSSTENDEDDDDASDDDIDMDTSSTHHNNEIDDDDDDDEGECSSSAGDQLNPSSNSEENDKLKTYPCGQCGKVRFIFQSHQSEKDNFSFN